MFTFGHEYSVSSLPAARACLLYEMALRIERWGLQLGLSDSKPVLETRCRDVITRSFTRNRQYMATVRDLGTKIVEEFDFLPATPVPYVLWPLAEVEMLGLLISEAHHARISIVVAIVSIYFIYYCLLSVFNISKSKVNFLVFRLARATCCTDERDIWRRRVDIITTSAMQGCSLNYFGI